MALAPEDVVPATKQLLEQRDRERPRLDRIWLYVTDPDPGVSLGPEVAGRLQTIGPLRWLPQGAPAEVRRLAEISRVNMLRYIVEHSVQALYVDGFRAPNAAAEEPAWDTWQRNRMDARQTAAHRAALTYGVAYVVVLPGDPVAALRPVSPRALTAVYGADDEWPVLALERRRSRRPGVALYRLLDEENVWWVEVDEPGTVTLLRQERHGVGVVPVVRFLTTLDAEPESWSRGEVEPLIPLQDQINVTSFGLLVAQHYGAFRQRYIIGWLAESEAKALEASARKLWTFEDENVKVGEFGQTDLKGYLDSREATLRALATVSQTPAHELLGQLVNLSAEALAAMERSHRAKIAERQVVFGEAWEQTLELAAEIDGQPSDPGAFVRWRDTEARSL
ncbi:MAG TPA: phage portal protein, partial [Actinomycetota bacterium]|nr:phage portal protein [Actinomycetota bacterium]